MKETKYRVFDRKDKYQQTYSPELDGSLEWAIQCANHTQGRVEEVTLENGDSFYYEIREKSRKRQTQIINEIEKLRDAGDSNSSDRADLLRDELKSEREELEHLSAFYTKAKGKSKS